MHIEKFQPTENDSWVWLLAQHTDIDQIIDLAKAHFEQELMTVFTSSEDLYRLNLTQAIAKQQYNLALEQVLVARLKTADAVLAYAWISRGSTLPYALEEYSEAKVLHIDQNMSRRSRIALTIQAITHWLRWTKACNIPVIVSSTIRSDQETFMRIHEQLGFLRRGSIAYKRL